MIVAIWKSGDCSKELLALLKEFALEAGLEPAAAGCDGYDLGLLGGTCRVEVETNSPVLRICCPVCGEVDQSGGEGSTPFLTGSLARGEHDKDQRENRVDRSGTPHGQAPGPS